MMQSTSRGGNYRTMDVDDHDLPGASDDHSSAIPRAQSNRYEYAVHSSCLLGFLNHVSPRNKNNMFESSDNLQ